MDTRVAEIITADGTVDRVTWFEPSYVNAKAFARSAVSNGQRPLDTRVKYLRVDRVGDMYVNEDGVTLNLPVNEKASYFANQKVVGDVVLVWDDYERRRVFPASLD